MNGKQIAYRFRRLSEEQRARVLRLISPPLSNKATEWLVEDGWSAELNGELEERREAIIETLVRVVDLEDAFWLLVGLDPIHTWTVPPRATLVQMQMPSFRMYEPPSGVSATDLAVTSVCLLQLQQQYRLAMTAVSPDVSEPEPLISVGSGSVQFGLSASGFGTGVLLVALALSGATLPIAAPAWAIAVGGFAIAGASGAQFVADVRKTWLEGSKARAEAVKAQQEAEKTREERERATQVKPGVAELFGIPDMKVRALASQLGVRPMVAYHLINRIGPEMVNTQNAGIRITVKESVN